MPVDRAKLKRQLKQKQKPQSAARPLEFVVISLLLVALIAIFGFIWQILMQRQSQLLSASPAMPVATSAEMLILPVTSTPVPAPQSWYVIVTPVPPKPTSVPRYDYSASSNAQAAAIPQAVYAPSDTQLCAGAAHCGVMTSCEQPLACLRLGRQGIDGDNDGWPCERTLCGSN